MPKQESGFYWTQGVSGSWDPAYWDAERGYWLTCGEAGPIHEDQFTRIGDAVSVPDQYRSPKWADH